MSELPTCQYHEPQATAMCGREVKTATMHDDGTFGPYLCAEHVKRVNNDRDQVRRLAAEKGWTCTDIPGTVGLHCTHPDQRDSVSWDPLHGVGAEEFVDALH